LEFPIIPIPNLSILPVIPGNMPKIVRRQAERRRKRLKKLYKWQMYHKVPKLPRKNTKNTRIFWNYQIA
jgi:hypothetical protein